MTFLASGSATLIGSLPHEDRNHALELVLRYCPEIPCWPQLTSYGAERMIPQFCQNLPGLKEKDGTLLIDSEDVNFEAEFLSFFEDYISVTEDVALLDQSRFMLSPEAGKTFFAFLDALQEKNSSSFKAVKGQITGPFTMLTSLVDQNKRYVLYDDRVSDMVVKSLSLQARWQVGKLKAFNVPVILFLDEPGLSGFGSSAFISVSASRIHEIINEVAGHVHLSGGLVGIHVCANTDWNLIFDSDVDILNFDAYGYFERFELYKEQIHKFISRGKQIAWGIVPTMNKEDIRRESADSLKRKCIENLQNLADSEEDLDTIVSHSLITPSCGCGSLPVDLAEKVLELNLEISRKLKQHFFS